MKEVILDILKIVAPVSVALIVFAQGAEHRPEAGRGLFQGAARD